jgi:hypothetical protein
MHLAITEKVGNGVTNDTGYVKHWQICEIHKPRVLKKTLEGVFCKWKQANQESTGKPMKTTAYRQG